MAAAKGFPTSAELYTQIKHDPYVFSHLVTIGYLDSRKNKIVQMPFNEWKSVDEGGDIPWHRVHNFTYNGKTLWDRKERICNVREIHDHNLHLPKVPYGKISLLTLNLFNEKAKGGFRFAAREEAILAFLRDMVKRVDFVLVQEVPESFFPALRSLSGEVADISVVTSEGTEDIVDHLGILSRHTATDSIAVKLNKTKCFLLAEFLTEDMRELRVCNVHLTSNLQTDSAAKRREQLLQVSKYAGNGHALIAGDFNDRDIMDIRGFQDVLGAFRDRPAEEFFTFVPASNPMAVGIPGCLDHVLLGPSLTPTSIRVMRDVILSDHFPLLCEVELHDVAPVAAGAGAFPAGTIEACTSDQTALCIVIPYRHWAAINSFKAHDIKEGSKDDRWMPHITISLGFVPASEFFRVELLLAPIVNSYLPLTISFSEPTVFDHPSGASTVVLEVDEYSRKQLTLLRDELASTGLWKMEHSGARRGEGYHPHLSLQRCASHEEGEKVVRKVAGALSFSFECTRLYMVSREKSSYMKVMNTVGGGPDVGLIQAIIKEGATEVRLAGSSLLQSLDPHYVARDNDVDLQVLISPPYTPETLIRRLETCGEIIMVKALSNAHGRYLQLHTKTPGLTFDLHVKTEGALGESGMDVVIDRARKIGKETFLAHAIAAVKRRLRNCHVYGQRFGFVPGYGLAIMVYKLIADDKTLSQEKVVEDFCAWYGREEPSALRVCNPSRTFSDMAAKHMVIQNMCLPGDNILRTVTATSVAKFRRALQCGLDASRFNAQEIESYPFVATFTLQANTLQNADAAMNWFGMKFLGMILQLEKSGGSYTHDDGWQTLEASPDYPFRNAFAIRSTSSLVPLLGGAAASTLQADFYSMFEECSFDVMLA